MQISGEAVVSSTGTNPTAATITIIGTGSTAGVNDNNGVLITDTNTLVTSVDGDISITGEGNGSGNNNEGFRLLNGADVITATANITLVGTGNGVDSNEGVRITNTGTTVTSTTGAISITGTSNGTGIGNEGEKLDLETVGHLDLLQNPFQVFGVLTALGHALHRPGIRAFEGPQLHKIFLVSLRETGARERGQGQAKGSQN